MSKTDHENLIREIAPDFNTYLKKGVRFGSLIGEIDPNLDIHDIEDLLRIYFILTTEEEFEKMDVHTPDVGVVDFVNKLPERLQHLPTSTSNERLHTYGWVEGRIDWDGTVRHRLQTNPNSKQRYVCETPQESYSDTPNRVLKRLLIIIESVLDTELAYALKDVTRFQWLAEWAEDDASLVDTFREDVMQNVYVKRIEVDDSHITNREIESVSNSRHPIFRESAELLRYYRRLLRYRVNQTEAKLLLQSIFITPDKENTETLFELYWVFRLLRCFENPKFRLIKRGTNELARWETDDRLFRMFHHSSGSSELSFRITNDLLSSEMSDNDNDSVDFTYINRRSEILERKNQIATTAFGVDTDKRHWAGQPDIILEGYSKEQELMGVFIGEAKYTRRIQEMVSGIEELLEYLYLVRSTQGYLLGESGSNIGWVQGGLFVDFRPTEWQSDDQVDIIAVEDDVSSERFRWGTG